MFISRTATKAGPAQKTRQYEAITFLESPMGINTVLGANQLEKDELTACFNWKFDKTGKLVTREGLTKTTNTPVPGSLVYATRVVLSATEYTLLIDSNNILYYIDDSSDPVLIGTLEGQAEVHSFGGYAIILDTGYIKTWDGTTLRIAYDEGTGSRGYVFDNSANDDSQLALGNGTNTRIGYKFTTASWTSGWTIPPTGGTVKLKRSGSLPATRVYVRLRRVSDDEKMAETYIRDASTGVEVTANSVSTDATEYNFTFSSSEVFAELAPAVAYYLCAEWQGGSAAAYLNVECSDETSGLSYVYAAATWTANTSYTPTMSLQPGPPPKASFGRVRNNRLWASGGSDFPGVCWYSNTNTPYDYSTASGGGYIGVIDGDTDSYQVGAMFKLFGNLYFLGKAENPYLAVLSGSIGSDVAINEERKPTWSHARVVDETENNAVFINPSGVYVVTGIEQYGDLSFTSVSYPISNIIKDYYDTSGFGCYNPNTKQYFAKLTGHSEVLVCHPDLPVQEGSGIRYPWVMYGFSGLTPTSFNYFDNEFYVGMSNGHLYRLDGDAFDDAGSTITYAIKSGVVEYAFTDTFIERVFLAAKVHGNIGTLTLQFLKSGVGSLAFESGWSLESGWSFETSTTFGKVFDLSVQPYDKYIGYITSRLQWAITDIIGCSRLYCSGVSFTTRPIGRK